MVDLGADPLQCRIDRQFHPPVPCLIRTDMRPQVMAVHGRHVEVSGEAEFARGSDQPKRLVVDTIELVTRVAGIDPARINEHSGWQELAEAQQVRRLGQGELGGLFENDQEVDEFLALLRDPGPTLA